MPEGQKVQKSFEESQFDYRAGVIASSLSEAHFRTLITKGIDAMNVDSTKSKEDAVDG